MERKGDMATIGNQSISKIVPEIHTEETTEWVIQVEQRFRNENYKSRQSSRDDVCIFKVPPVIRDFNPKAYDAYVVPLGPFFHSQDKKDLHAVDDYKLSAVESTLQRLNVTGIENLITIVMESDNKSRDCYQDRAIECSKKMLAWMMTMGACFIIGFICEDFNVYFQMRMQGLNDVVIDILKLENQIPLLILKRILELDRDNNALSQFISMIYTLSPFRSSPFPMELKKMELKERIKEYIIDGRASHLLDLNRMLVRDFLLGSLSNSGSASTCASAKRRSYFFTKITHRLRCMCRFITLAADNKQSRAAKLPLPSAEKLAKAGIRFEQSVDGKIRFETRGWGSATFFLPQIRVGDSAEIYLRNLMA